MKRFLSLLFIIFYILLFFNTNNIVKADEEHKHCDCYNKICYESEHKSESAWTGISELPVLDNTEETLYYYLTKNITLTSYWTIPKNKEIHLCLNGYTITTADQGIKDYLIYVEGKLTITDCQNTGSIESLGKDGIFKVNGSGTLNIYSGNFVQNGKYKHIIQTDNAENGSRTVNIYGGTFTNEAIDMVETDIFGFLVSKKGSVINIFDGEFIVNNKDTGSSPYLLNTDGSGKFNIYGGYFKAKYYGYSVYSFSTATITNAIFETLPKEYIAGSNDIDISKILDSNHEIIEINNQYVVRANSYSVGDKYFATLDDAIKYVSNNNDVIKVLKNQKLESTEIEKNFILDLNGKTITGIGIDNKPILLISSEKLQIKDTSNPSTGEISAINQSSTLIRVDGGELVIYGGSFSNKIDSYKSYVQIVDCKDGTITLEGGNYKVLNGYSAEENIFSSVIAATKVKDAEKSIINIKDGTYTAESNDGNFSSRIFTPYKNNDNDDFGVINVSGGIFNGDYNNPQLTTDSGKTKDEIRGYLNITGGAFDRNEFPGSLYLDNMIDLDNYYTYSNGNPAYYYVAAIPHNPAPKYEVVNTGID